VSKINVKRGFFLSVLGTRFGPLELKIGSLESEKIIIRSLHVHTGYLTVSLKKLVKRSDETYP